MWKNTHQEKMIFSFSLKFNVNGVATIKERKEQLSINL